MDSADPLRRALGAASAATDKKGRVAALSALIADRAAMDGLIVKVAEDPDVVEALLLEFEAVPGMSAGVGRLRVNLRKSAAVHTRAQSAKLRVASDGEMPAFVMLSDHLPQIEVPDRYVVTRQGVQEKKETPEGVVLVRLTRRPILPTLILADIDTGERSVQLEWLDRKGWGSRIVKASTVQDPRAFVKMRDFGAPVAGHNARLLARFLDEVEEGNVATIPRAFSASRMGWMRGGELGFALGHEVIGSEHVRVELDPDGAEVQIADALQPKGSEALWADAVRKVTAHPSAMVALYASICAPLLEVLPSAPNAIFGWCGETSTGKTTALRLAASVWGNPDERAMGLVQKWNQTPAFLERMAAFCTSLPVCLDDTNDVPNDRRDMIPSMLYQFAGGKGKGRAKPDGTRRTESWRSVLLSTGEAALTSYSQDAGARARTIVLSGQPFGDGEQGGMVADVTVMCLDNYGHLGPRVVRHIHARRNEWPEMVARYADRCAHYADKADSTVAGRLGKIVALLELGREIGEACGLPAAECDPIAYVWEAAKLCGADTDRPLAALRAVHGWAVSHSSEFWGRHIKDRDDVARQPPRGWAGKWDRGMWDRLAFVPDCLDRVLRFHGYDPGAVLPLWHERGWLMTSEGRPTCKIRIDGENTRCVALSRDAISNVE